ncbi:MAG: signal peptide peptidase SppA [Deltaproteobacteria bacterium]|nr:MAG: signal peptide peptidase SppA [Deltaproteobacteria bacterium]
MQKRPLFIALALLGGIFLFFLVLVLTVSRFFDRPARFVVRSQVGVVEVEGVIVDSKKIIEQLDAFHENSSVKAIVLRVDSPGGGVGPSQEIHDEVKRIDADKPVVVSMGSVAASGGYYIAAPAREIFANPGTITGSIGVIMEFANFQELLDKIGLHSEVVKSGKHKDIGSPVRPMTEEDRALLQGLIDDVHGQFVDSVAAGRQLDVRKVRSLADGRIFSGRQARDLGLVDHLGNLEAAVRRAGELAGIEGKPEVVYPPSDKPQLIDLLIQEASTQLSRALLRQQGGKLQYVWSGFN